MKVQEFFDAETYTLTYLAYDDRTKDAVVIDPVWNYDPASSKLSDKSAKALIAWIKERGLKIHFSLETHAHADHVSASQIVRSEFAGCKVAIGEYICEVQTTFREILGLSQDFAVDGSQFDLLLKDGQTVQAGSLKIRVMSTPGHTPACMTYIIEDAAFVGDAIFMPDYGTGRCDFPAGSAQLLFESIQRIYQLPPETRIFTGHDYQPGGRPLRFCATVKEQLEGNIQLSAKVAREDFIKFRKARDLTLNAPRLLLPSIQLNIDAGHLPKPDAKGRRFLRIPLHS